MSAQFLPALASHAGRTRARLSAFRLALVCALAPSAAQAQAANNGLTQFIDPLKSGLNLIMVFGFIAGCVMVMSGFLNARRDENWKMNVIYGIGVAGAVVLMKALFGIFGGNVANTVNGF